jgi:hypothetical protein
LDAHLKCKIIVTAKHHADMISSFCLISLTCSAVGLLSGSFCKQASTKEQNSGENFSFDGDGDGSSRICHKKLVKLFADGSTFALRLIECSHHSSVSDIQSILYWQRTLTLYVIFFFVKVESWVHYNYIHSHISHGRSHLS